MCGFIIELLATQSILTVTRVLVVAVVGVPNPWMLLRLQMGSGRLFHCYLANW